ncbi:MAG: cytochrome c maturation protein CcmE [Gemmatimonadetes bacterium]|nr:cytochrome c maturation protein CcmE [Gemmatimonadota bacterium]MBP6669961.1 cytochrome c maturation protein CcmE [Gemmatimonadales bacterium]MBK6778394.1 cytochrome c maturation protein CcmE [Gemmatimonadota bacterium]MBK7349294.1 cytochrome c maturation protein CcmE [Gemmatimonadota bacterium]MBK7714862.1 cytochrome c maturation protein CcmE [Gemmatimonadota bacterium]
MKAGTKFLIGAGIIVGATTILMAQGVKQFGQYSLKPSELAQRVERDPSLYETGVKMEAKVVPGTIRRDAASQTIQFSVSDGLKTIPVTYRGLAPDTFTDAQEIEVVVEGRLSKDGVFHATTLLAKCGSRYEAQYKEEGTQA